MSAPIHIAVAVVEHNSAYLVGQRPPGVPLAGLSEFPGGKVQPGEAPSAAAVRECLEESGLAVEVTGEYPAVLHDYPHGQLHIHFFACRSLHPDTPPLAPFRWVPRAALAALEFPAANATLLQDLLLASR